MKAPKDWPAPPVHLIVKVSSGRELPWMRVMSLPRMAPRVRSVEVTGMETVFFYPAGRAFFSFFSSFMSTVFSSSKSKASAGSKWRFTFWPS